MKIRVKYTVHHLENGMKQEGGGLSITMPCCYVGALFQRHHFYLEEVCVCVLPSTFAALWLWNGGRSLPVSTLALPTFGKRRVIYNQINLFIEGRYTTIEIKNQEIKSTDTSVQDRSTAKPEENKTPVSLVGKVFDWFDATSTVFVLGKRVSGFLTG